VATTRQSRFDQLKESYEMWQRAADAISKAIPYFASDTYTGATLTKRAEHCEEMATLIKRDYEQRRSRLLLKMAVMRLYINACAR
jgi:hypothetical protein